MKYAPCWMRVELFSSVQVIIGCLCNQYWLLPYALSSPDQITLPWLCHCAHDSVDYMSFPVSPARLAIVTAIIALCMPTTPFSFLLVMSGCNPSSAPPRATTTHPHLHQTKIQCAIVHLPFSSAPSWKHVSLQKARVPHYQVAFMNAPCSSVLCQRGAR